MLLVFVFVSGLERLMVPVSEYGGVLEWVQGVLPLAPMLIYSLRCFTCSDFRCLRCGFLCIGVIDGFTLSIEGLAIVCLLETGPNINYIIQDHTSTAHRLFLN